MTIPPVMLPLSCGAVGRPLFSDLRLHFHTPAALSCSPPHHACTIGAPVILCTPHVSCTSAALHKESFTPKRVKQSALRQRQALTALCALHWGRAACLPPMAAQALPAPRPLPLLLAARPLARPLLLPLLLLPPPLLLLLPRAAAAAGGHTLPAAPAQSPLPARHPQQQEQACVGTHSRARMRGQADREQLRSKDKQLAQPAPSRRSPRHTRAQAPQMGGRRGGGARRRLHSAQPPPAGRGSEATASREKGLGWGCVASRASRGQRPPVSPLAAGEGAGRLRDNRRQLMRENQQKPCATPVALTSIARRSRINSMPLVLNSDGRGGCANRPRLVRRGSSLQALAAGGRGQGNWAGTGHVASRAAPSHHLYNAAAAPLAGAPAAHPAPAAQKCQAHLMSQGGQARASKS